MPNSEVDGDTEAHEDEENEEVDFAFFHGAQFKVHNRFRGYKYFSIGLVGAYGIRPFCR